MFTENKITELKNKIQNLADRPQMSAQALKEYFDGSAEELRIAHNALVDALSGFAPSAFTDVRYDAETGKLTFVLTGGEEKEIDLPLELLVKSGHYDTDAQNIVLVLASGDTLTIPVGDLVDTYHADESTLVCENNTFSVKDGVFAKPAQVQKEIADAKTEVLAEAKVYTDARKAEITADIAAAKAYADACTAETLETARAYAKEAADEAVVDAADYADMQCDGVKAYADNAIRTKAQSERKLKLLQTITLEEDVAQIDVEFDKPLDEIAILFDVAFLKAETGAMAVRTYGGAWYMFYAASQKMNTTKQYFFAHAKEVSDRQWECLTNSEFRTTLQGIGSSTTNAKLVVSKRPAYVERYVSAINILMPNNTTENAFAAGSTIEIWGHEADE